ncbi:MAG: EF-P lysine aminoacylase EpmA [Gammaproteobacteria bacterium]
MAADWRPNCSLQQLQNRAQLLQKIRAFFTAKGVLEVDTPLLCHGIGSDPNLDFFSTRYHIAPEGETLYLQTSPEFAMKRLLAAGSGSIFQICKAFRNGESGRFHNPEFTLLEWYRVGFDLSALMDEVTELLRYMGEDSPAWQQVERYAYSDVFRRYTGLNALDFSPKAYLQCAVRQGLPEAEALCGGDHVMWLDLLFSHLVQPHLGQQALCLIYDYPACQSSLARFKPGQPLLTERVEIFVRGVELGNGFYELADVQEQERRFEEEIGQRRCKNLPVTQPDRRLLAALQEGLPDCAGMAIGVDRLLMLLGGCEHIDAVLAFPVASA